MQRLMLPATMALLLFSVTGNCSLLNNAQQSETEMKSMTVAQLEQAGENARAQKEYREAVRYFTEAIQQDGKNAKLYNKRGLAELSSGNYPAARADFAKATKYNRNYPEAWNDLAVAYYLDKDYRAAAKYFKKAIALDENRASFHVNLGVTYFSMNDTERAMQEYTRASELDPNALLHSSNFGGSAQLLTQAERAKQEFLMARVYAKLGNIENCLACLKKAKDEGYGDLANVYKDEDFASVRQDARLAQIVPPPAAAK